MSTPKDQAFFDPVAYGNGPDDSVTATDESAAITHHSVTIGGHKINYTATAGHLVIVDRSGLWKGKPVKGLTEGLRQKGGLAHGY